MEDLAKRPEAENLVNIYAGLSDQSAENVIAEFAGAQFSTFKNALADLAVVKLTPIATAMQRYLSDRAEVDRILSSGAARARVIAEPVMREVRRLVGFGGCCLFRRCTFDLFGAGPRRVNRCCRFLP